MKLLQTLSLQSAYNEVEKVEGLLTKLQDELGFTDEFYARLMLTISEAATNSIVHGNKLDEAKIVEISAYTDGHHLIVETKDQGEGFDPDKIPDPTAGDNLFKPSGRGVFLMEEYADVVKYSEGGSKLTLIFELPKG